MKKVFLISGLGADKRLFKNIKLPDGFKCMLVDWHIPDQEDTLATYAQAIVKQNDIKPGDIVLGVSLGGMLSVEIAKQVKLAKVILVSSIKSHTEAPWYFSVFRRIPVYRVTPDSLLTGVGFMVRPVFGPMAPGDLALFQIMLASSSPIFIKWAMGAVLHWQNNVVLPNLYHIIGDKDLVFPYKNIKQPTAIIKGGTHIMVFDRAAEINHLLEDILEEK